ncbi:hypothetical protein [Arthrobacter crystallopoietes]|uniref:Uncharacterized protein n=1 Tax=Crystallibacter crystallopoietes TaxID=37928 RepID=A0A1H1GBQ1_9MICC|nr:hypothetical protein [Arthrobacter crystallopoietes]AUI52654.1 hypothetical protein AC20117_19455 [Arthrobacter crystallopoietes]SDR10702.1 hypothetical protein SAMN04489742_3986 [Arthrobacter crystallopoietes]
MEAIDGRIVAVAVGFAVLIVLFIVLLVLMARRSKGTNARSSMKGINVTGVTASTVIDSGDNPQAVMGRVRDLIARSRRYSDLSEGDDSLRFRVKGNFWSWGGVVTLDLAPHDRGTRIQARCQPWLKTTMIDYGQR